MAHIVTMPQIGISEESAILAKWAVKTGQTVAVGDVLFSLETGKSAFDVESEAAGVVLKLLADEGDEVLIQTPVCVIGQAGEALPDLGVADKAEPAPAAKQEVTAPAAAIAPVASTAKAGATGISPRARQLAETAGVNAAQATATGPEGRIIERDVRTLIESGAAPTTVATPTAAAAGDYTDVPFTTMRKIIAKNMMASLSNTAQLTHTASFDATQILAYRKTAKSDPVLGGITLGDMILYAVSRTLKDFPALNAWLQNDSLRVFNEVNLAVAVDTDKGLLVPVIYNASRKSLLEISNELKALAVACRDGKIAPELLTGGSFTVSNLGAFGIESFTPILNAPQTGILGVNTITQRVRAEGTSFSVYSSMSLSLTYDHRALDGAPASKFLQTLCKNLENFYTLL